MFLCYKEDNEGKTAYKPLFCLQMSYLSETQCINKFCVTIIKYLGQLMYKEKNGYFGLNVKRLNLQTVASFGKIMELLRPSLTGRNGTLGVGIKVSLGFV